MPTYAVAYRVTGYEPRSEQSNLGTEPDILFPLAGAAHAEAFRYSSLPVAGFQPFLVAVSGRKGRYSPLTRSTDIGQMQVQILDRKLATSQQVRHVTAFLGDAVGRNRLIGCKVLIEESIDGGATWAPHFTGRIGSMRLDGRTVLEFTLRSLLADFKIPVFIGRPAPAVTYAAIGQYAPFGQQIQYGPVPPAVGVPMTFDAGLSTFAALAPSAVAALTNVVSDALRAAVPTQRAASGVPRGLESQQPTVIRARCTFTTGALAGQTREYRVRGCYTYPAGARFLRERPGGEDALYGVAVAVLPSTADPFYAALPANGDQATIAIVGPDTPPSAAVPMRINDVHPVQFAEDLALGRFSYLNPDATIRRRVPLNAASFTALKNDPTFSVYRGRITAKDDAKRFATERLGRIYGFGFRDTATGEIEVFDARVPTSLAGVATLTDDDRYADAPLEWQQGRDDAITRVEVTTYYESLAFSLSSSGPNDLQLSSGTITETPYTEATITGFREDGDENVLELDADGLRFFEAETLQGRRRQDVVQAQARRLVDEFRGLYGSAPMQVRVTARRTATVMALRPGSVVQATWSELPDPATSQRGGPRLFRVLEVSEDGLPVTLELLDLGPASVALAPTVGALGAGADAAAQITVPITRNAANDPVQLEVASTATSVTLLADVPAAAWQLVEVVTANTTVTVSGLPSGRRIWVRARSIGTGATSVRLPSAYVSPSPAFRDTTALAAPTGLSVVSQTARVVTLGWTAGPASASVQVAFGLVPTIGLVTATGGFPTLPPGSTRYQIQFDDAGAGSATLARFAVRFIDAFGGVSPWEYGPNYTNTGASPVAPTPTLVVL